MSAAGAPERDTKPQYTGRLDRAIDMTIVGVLRDAFGWEIIITGHRDIENGGYILEGRLGETPAALRIPLLDDK